ncbi:MAG TPA: FadR/GntR family transcriptional regulator [bacterium]|jgi:GntR family transcriptional repressor for pyruvate dehydrogenase complex|nr:FadR/GntR family transcriptional regulator [bacterium]
MPITPVKTTKLYLLIVEQLKQLIRKGEFRPGDRLPTERELAQRLKVSRAPTREALVALELLDVVEGRVGEGWFVKRPPDASLETTAEQGRTPSDILQARILIECMTIEQATRAHDGDDVAALTRAVDAFQGEVDRGLYSGEADRLFHLTLARISGNTVLSEFVAYLWDLQNGRFFQLTEGMSGRQGERVQRYVAEHRAMLLHVVAGDANGASIAMRAHLEGVYRDLLDTEVPASPQ